MHDIARSGVPLGLTLVALVADVRRREVPDGVPLAIAVWAVVAMLAGWNDVSGLALVAGSLLGLATGAVLYAWFGFGGGDAKLLAALGAALGPGAFLSTLLWTAVAGGLLALVARSRRQRDFAYVPAIVAGLCIHAAWPL